MSARRGKDKAGNTRGATSSTPEGKAAATDRTEN